MALRALTLLTALCVAMPALAKHTTVVLAAGDCVQPYDGVVDLFDVGATVDAVLGRTDPGIGCDADCNGVVDWNDVGLTVDRALHRVPPAECHVKVNYGDGR